MTQFLDKLERLIRPVAIPNLTVILVAGQTIFFLVLVSRPELFEQMIYVPDLVMRGEVWRLLTFMVMPAQSYSFLFFTVPSSTNFFFFFLQMSCLYLMGSALENQWGVARYNLFLLIGYVLTIGVSLFFPAMPAGSGFIYGSIFLVFAFLYPEFQILLYFILPVKAKWIATAFWVLWGLMFIFGSWQIRLIISASVGNYFLFLGPEVYRKMRYGAKTMQNRVSRIADAEKPFHVCTTCGKTDKTHPMLEFRYCPKCKGSPGYCSEHIAAHEHR
jgi:membrane associated rhomboid family serine protease